MCRESAKDSSQLELAWVTPDNVRNVELMRRLPGTRNRALITAEGAIRGGIEAAAPD